MPRRFRPRITYANVASTLALVIALGGVSYAAVKINGNSLKDRTVGAKKIKKNVLGGTEINEGKVGRVPLAGAALNADTVGGQGPQSFKLSCPQGTTAVIGLCFEPNQRTAATWKDANKVCGAAGRRLPTIAELDSARQNNFTVGVPPNNYELSASLVYESGDKVYSISPAGDFFRDLLTGTRPYRCVQAPTN